MLKVYRYGESIETPCALVLGGFDGLHAGHRVLLARGKEAGLPCCVTTILGGKSGMLFTKEEREYIFQCEGIDFVYEIPFDEQLKNTSAENFLIELLVRINAKKLVCGEDFRFGKNAEGTPELLSKLALCPVEVVQLVKWDDEKLATSACKRFLKAGDLESLGAWRNEDSGPYLDYFIQGKVEHGRQVGRTYGFPTLNLNIPSEKLLPKDGVYIGLADTPKGTYKTIINIGACPTFDVSERKIEAYLDGFAGDLYGETVRIYPTKYHRGIEKFASAEALKEQLQRDIQRLRGIV